MLESFLNIIKIPKKDIFWLIVSFFVFAILRTMPVFEILQHSYSIPGLPFWRKIEIFYEYIFVYFLDTAGIEQFLTIALAILTGFNVVLFIDFARRQKKILSKRSLFASISGIFFGLFGVGCLSCGAFVLAPVITFFGLGAYGAYFTKHAVILSVIGLILVLASNIYLLYQISRPLVCKN